MSRRASATEFRYFIEDFDHALASVTFADKLFTARQAFVIDEVEYINVTGLAAGATYWTIGVKVDAVVAADWSTLTGADGVLTADVVNSIPIEADPAMRGAAGAVVSFFGTETGVAADLPAGRVVIHGHYI